MKKIFLCLSLLLSFNLCFSQANVTVDVYDPIYQVLDSSYERGLCSPLVGARPYTEKKIISILDEILSNEDKLLETEKQIILDYKEKTERSSSNKTLGSLYFENDEWSGVLNTFQLYYGFKTDVSTGFYNTSKYNSTGFDIMPNFGFSGDIGNNFGYNIQAVLDVGKMPLFNNGDYNIGLNWYDSRTQEREITSYTNWNYLPYSYRKPWGGQFYWLSNMSASGLEGWAHETGVSGNIFAELHASLLNDKINIGLGRMYREWASMDSHSSLVLNGTAMPFFGLDLSVELLPFLTYSSLSGTLEYPNRDDILWGSFPGNSQDDTNYFQNAFSINMVEFNYKGLHLDFGSTVIWPKRFEFGYLFPLTNYVEYQNHIGDCDNLALFGDIKYTKTGLGSIWASLFLDEINGLNNNPIKFTRAMFATQAGVKAVLPSIPFGSLSLRYTKIEPFCYTHHSINYVPYYADYICENYSNNGISLGSYLPPNSDEIMLRFDAMPKPNLNTSFAFQLIRHGAEHGSQQVKGSSIYSELDNKDRDGMQKAFLHDGAYNWLHILSINTSYSSRKTAVPFKINLTVGGVISYYTAIDNSVYKGPDQWYGGAATDYGNCKGDYSIIDTDEYPFTVGGVISLGVTIGHF